VLGVSSRIEPVTSPVPRLRRAGTVMDRIAKEFTDEEIQAIAAWYATQR